MATLMTYLVPAFFAFVVGLTLWLIRRERYALEYEIVASDSFPRDSGEGRSVVVRLRNSGNRQLETVAFVATFHGEEIEHLKVSDPELFTNVRRQLKRFEADIPLINPNETLSVSVTTILGAEVTLPEISARAPGATAQKKGDSNPFEYLAPVAMAVTVSVAANSVYSAIQTRKIEKTIPEAIEKTKSLEEITTGLKKANQQQEKSLEDGRLQLEALKKQAELVRTERERYEKDRNEGKPQSAQVIFALLNRAGMPDKALELASLGDGLTYWGTSLSMLRGFLSDFERQDQYVKVVAEIVKLEHVAPSTRGFSMYLLAKMEQERGNPDKAVGWLDACHKQTPQMYEHLMAQDPAFDLDAIKRKVGNVD